MIKRMRRINRVHFVGIGGSGMSGIAEVMLSLGYQVQGSDLKSNAQVKRLETHGATIFIGHDAKNIRDDDAVVAGAGLSQHQLRQPQPRGGTDTRSGPARRPARFAPARALRLGSPVNPKTTGAISSLS